MTSDSQGRITFPVQSNNSGGTILASYSNNGSSGGGQQGITVTPGVTNYTMAINTNTAYCPAPTDSTPPVLGSFTWTLNPKMNGDSTELYVIVSDMAGDSGIVSGVKTGEFFLGDSDPGVGKATPMIYTSCGNGVGSCLYYKMDIGAATTHGQAGIYKVNVRAEDAAGNWSTLKSDNLVSYDASKTAITGRTTTTTPALSNGDVLPGLTQSGQTNKAAVAFNVLFNNFVSPDNEIHLSTQSTFSLSYQTGTCGNKPVNCSNFSLSAPTFDWMICDSTNTSRCTVQGKITTNVNGATTTNPFRLVTLDNTKLTPATTDKIGVYVYSPGANPFTAAPIYQMNDLLSSGSVTIQ